MANRWVERFKPKMYKVSWVLSSLFLLCMFFDIWSTVRIPPEYLEFLEMNPLFPFIGIGGIILLNFLALYIFIMAIKNSPPYGRFIVISAFVVLNLFRVFVVINNLSVGDDIYQGELTLEELDMPTPVERAEFYAYSIVIGMALWLFVMSLTYFLFSLDNKVTRKDD